MHFINKAFCLLTLFAAIGFSPIVTRAQTVNYDIDFLNGQVGTITLNASDIMAESTDPAVISFEATVDGQTYTSVTDGGKATYDSSGDLYSIYLYNDNNPEFELSMEGNITSPTSAPWLIDDGSQNPEFPTLTDIGIYVLTPTVIPEPTSLTLLAFTAAGLMGRRTTRRLRSTF